MYKFTEDCLTGIEEIDNEHRELFGIINGAMELLGEEAGTVASVKNLVLHLKKYAEQHFAHEEAYMEKISDPELERQKKEHAEFAEKINSVDLEGLTEENGREALQDLVNYLAKWLYHHILGSDIMIGKMQPVSRENKGMFEFTDNYKTNIDFVDREHKKLFEIIERTYDVINAQFLADKYDQIVSIIDELREYTKLHFSDEEKYMEEIGYEGIAAQKLAHESFIDRLACIDMDAVDDSQQEYLCELIDFLLEWLKNHILKMDKKIPVKK